MEEGAGYRVYVRKKRQAMPAKNGEMPIERDYVLLNLSDLTFLEIKKRHDRASEEQQRHLRGEKGEMPKGI